MERAESRQARNAPLIRADALPSEPGTFTDIGDLYRDGPATPRGVPLHPGAERWCREHGIAY